MHMEDIQRGYQHHPPLGSDTGCLMRSFIWAWQEPELVQPCTVEQKGIQCSLLQALALML